MRNFCKLFIVILVQNSCQSQSAQLPKHEVQIVCRILNDSATGMYVRWLENDSLEYVSKAIELSKEAIKCDTLFALAVDNLFKIYFQTEQYSNCLDPLLRLLKITNGTEPYPLTNLSICYRHINNIPEAERYEKLALDLCKLNYSRDDSFEHFQDLIFTNLDFEQNAKAKSLFLEYSGKYDSRQKEIQFLQDYIDQEIRK